MKKRSWFLFIALLSLTSCTYTLPDGRRYKLKQREITHIEHVHHKQMRRVPFSLVRTYEEYEYDEEKVVIDGYVYDTIWLPKKH